MHEFIMFMFSRALIFDNSFIEPMLVYKKEPKRGDGGECNQDYEHLGDQNILVPFELIVVVLFHKHVHSNEIP